MVIWCYVLHWLFDGDDLVLCVALAGWRWDLVLCVALAG